MTPPDSYVPPTWQLDENASDVGRVASASISHGFPLPSSLGSDPNYPYASPCSTAVNQADFDPIEVDDYSLAFFASNLSFDSSDSDAAATFSDQTQDYIPWISSGLEYGLGPVLTEEPGTIDVPQTRDEIPWCSVASSFDPLSTSYPTNPHPQSSSSDSKMEESFRLTAGPYIYPLVGMPPPGWDIGQPQAGLSYENPPIFNFADPTVGVDDSSYPGEKIQMVATEVVQNPPYTASSSFEQQLILSMAPAVRPCEWKDADGTVCGAPITRETLPGHLSKHGIEKMTRNHPTKCNWVGCKKKKPMNRESIVRHIREVHMRLRRPSKRAQEPCLNTGSTTMFYPNFPS